MLNVQMFDVHEIQKLTQWMSTYVRLTIAAMQMNYIHHRALISILIEHGKHTSKFENCDCLRKRIE